jgi:hypothetical protein
MVQFLRILMPADRSRALAHGSEWSICDVMCVKGSADVVSGAGFRAVSKNGVTPCSDHTVKFLQTIGTDRAV